MSANERSRMRTIRSLPIMLTLLLCVFAGVAAAQSPLVSPGLDPSCIRFDDPNAVVNGEIVYAGFTAYELGLDHAVAAWSPDRGFAVALREAVPAGDSVPEEANLIYRDAMIPGTAFKGVTVTWTHTPATITLNRATLPPPETTDPVEQDLIRTVVTHETGHALGLGDVPAPGVNIRECANMLMKRSVDKGGGRFSEPQPGDIALYCMRWGGAICGDDPPPTIVSDPARTLTLEPHAVASPNATTTTDQPAMTYRYFVVKCEQLPAADITPDQVESGDLPTDSQRECVRAPAGVLFHIHRDDGSGEVALTDRWGEFVVQKPEGLGVDIDMPAGGNGRFPSLIGYQPVEVFDRIPGIDPDCEPGTEEACKRVYVLVP